LICWQRKLRGQLEKIDLDRLLMHAVSVTERNYNGFSTLATSRRDEYCKWGPTADVLRLLDERLLTAASLFGHLV
jgi:hypothetical protein